MKGCLKWVIIVILVIAAIGACTAAIGSDDDSSKGNDTGKKTESSKEFKIGDTVKVGNMQYKVNSVETAKVVGPTYGKTKAKDTFVVIDLTVKNNGDESATVDSGLFKLLKGSKTFEADSNGSMSVNQSEDGNIDNSFFLEQVNPESKLTGKVVFDVSNATATSKDIKLQVQTGMFGTETEVIKLTK